MKYFLDLHSVLGDGDLNIEDEEKHFEFCNGYFSVHDDITVFSHVLFERFNPASFHVSFRRLLQPSDRNSEQFQSVPSHKITAKEPTQTPKVPFDFSMLSSNCAPGLYLRLLSTFIKITKNMEFKPVRPLGPAAIVPF